jgi:hypothetical protein
LNRSAASGVMTRLSRSSRATALAAPHRRAPASRHLGAGGGSAVGGAGSGCGWVGSGSGGLELPAAGDHVTSSSRSAAAGDGIVVAHPPRAQWPGHGVRWGWSRRPDRVGHEVGQAHVTGDVEAQVDVGPAVHEHHHQGDRLLPALADAQPNQPPGQVGHRLVMRAPLVAGLLERLTRVDRKLQRDAVSPAVVVQAAQATSAVRPVASGDPADGGHAGRPA